MIFDDNYYTYLLSKLTSAGAKINDSSYQVIFLVGEKMIFADIVDDEDPKLNKTEAEAEDTFLFLAASRVLSNRNELIKEKFSEDERKELEPVYFYLENVTVHSTSNNKSIHLPTLALRISSIDGISSGSTESLPK